MGKQKKSPQKKSLARKIVRFFWMLITIGVLGLALVFVYAGLFGNIPSFEELENPKSNLATEIISSDNVSIGSYHIENRSYISYDSLSPHLVNALVATEDIRYYDHSGIDFKSLGRVVVKTVMLGNTRGGGGGSTITQQLALNLFSQRSSNKLYRAVVQKPAEWITAIKLERNYTKDEIISMYFNTVFYGSNAYGIRSAASTFFGKLPSQLTVEESAMLVGLVNAPTTFNPVRNPERALNRRNHVISQMAKYDFITTHERDSLQAIPITLNYQPQDHLSSLAPYFRDMLRRVMNMKEPKRENYKNRYEDYRADSLSWADDPFYGWLNKNLKPDGSSYDLDRDGLKIYTTVDSRMQRYAEQAVEEHLKKDLQPVFSNEVRRRRNFPFSNDLTKQQADQIVQRAITNTDRYRGMKNAGASAKEIEVAFATPTQMTIFSWSKGTIDTLMSPRDSILYYKSLLRASIMAIEPSTGFVRAYVGGPNYRYFKYDNIRQSRRQVGSTIKPFLYTLAMQQGMSPCDQVLNVSQTFIVGDTTWTPKTTDREEWIGKKVTLKWGLTHSSNNISAYLMKEFNPHAMVDICRRMGIRSWIDAVPALCLGSCDLSLFEMVGAYNTFPSKGIHVEPFFVTRIEDNAGNILGSFIPRQSEALSDRTAYLSVNLMQGVVNEGSAYRIRSRYIPEGQIAGKTGTTNNQSDGWFIGFMPKLTAGVWVGAEDRDVHFESLALGGGSNMALPIWGLFMQKVLADTRLNIHTTDMFDVPQGVPAVFSCTGADDETSQTVIEKDDFF